MEDMLRACALEFSGKWEKYLSLAEFAYNNSYQASIGMPPYEALYGRKFRTPVCWNEVGERRIDNSEFIDEANDKIRVIRGKMKQAQDRQKSYADKRRRPLEFNVGDSVFLKVAPWKGVLRFTKRGKLNPRYIGPFPIVERIGSMAYRLDLPTELAKVHNVFHVSMLKKYVPDASHVLTAPPVEIQENMTYEILPVKILDRQFKQLRHKLVPLVKVLWKRGEFEEQTWETEESIRRQHPQLFE